MVHSLHFYNKKRRGTHAPRVHKKTDIREKSWAFYEIQGLARLWSQHILDFHPKAKTIASFTADQNLAQFLSPLATLYLGGCFVSLNHCASNTHLQHCIKIAQIDVIIVDEIFLEKILEIIQKLKKPPMILISELLLQRKNSTCT